MPVQAAPARAGANTLDLVNDVAVATVGGLATATATGLRRVAATEVALTSWRVC